MTRPSSTSTTFLIIFCISVFTALSFYFVSANTSFNQNKVLADGLPSPTITPYPTATLTIIDLSPQPLPTEQPEINLSEAADAFYGGPDVDCDGIRSSEDNCPFTYNPDQEDKDKNRIGDACDGANKGNLLSRCDNDGDEIPDYRDNCPLVCNPNQVDKNRNGIGDVCDPHILSNWTRINPCSKPQKGCSKSKKPNSKVKADRRS